MPTPEQIQRFLSECLLYRAALKSGAPLSEHQVLLIKTKVYELLLDLDDAQRALSHDSTTTILYQPDPAPPEPPK